MSPGESSIGLKQFAHLFLSGDDSKDPGESVIPESLIWIMVSGISPMRAFLGSGISSCIARHGINVTLVENGGGLPNAGYYFALEAEEYLLPVLEKNRLLKRSVSDSLRFVYARDSSVFEPFDGGLVRDKGPHIVVGAFNFLPGFQNDYLEELLRISTMYSLNNGITKLFPDVIIIVNYGCVVQESGLFDSIVAFAPKAAFFEVGGISDEAAGRFNIEQLDISTGIDASFGRRLPPSDPFFSGFTNTLLQKIGSSLKGR